MDSALGLAALAPRVIQANTGIPIKQQRKCSTSQRECIDKARSDAGARIRCGKPSIAGLAMAYPSPRGILRMGLRFAQHSSAVPGTLAVMDGKFIPCHAKEGHIKDFKSVKGRGFTIHCVCDYDRRIIDYCGGHVATAHDSSVLAASSFGKRSAAASLRRSALAKQAAAKAMTTGEVLRCREEMIQDFDEGKLPFPIHSGVAMFAIGDGAYPLRAHIMVPYSSTSHFSVSSY